jgi:hypothetical protein
MLLAKVVFKAGIRGAAIPQAEAVALIAPAMYGPSATAVGWQLSRSGGTPNPYGASLMGQIYKWSGLIPGFGNGEAFGEMTNSCFHAYRSR